MICTLTKYYSSDQLWKNEMRGTRNRYGKQERCTQGDFMESNHLEELGIEGRTILKEVFKTWEGRHGLDCSG
jgi:hypothetical protein